MLDRLLTVGEAAKIAGFSRSKMYVLARSGGLPFKQLGSTYHISLSVLCAELGLSAEGREKEQDDAKATN